jgi:predicted lactoylglutathione lyase
MLLVESYFTTLTKKGVVDATRSAEAILQLRVESKERVDDLVDKALAVGGLR